MKRFHISVLVSSLMLCGAGQPSSGEVVARANGCFDCHKMNELGIGPSFHDIARRYRENEGAKAALVEVVKKGGKGNWTAVTKGVPMPHYSPRISDQEIEQLVDWVLGQ